MNVTTATTLAGLAASAATAWSLGGRAGTGVMAGYLAGAFVSGIAMLLQRAAAQHRPQLLLHAVLGGFVIKAFALLALTLTVALVPSIAAACDPVAFLISFAGAALVILLPATLDTLKLLRAGRREAEGTASILVAPRTALPRVHGLGGRTP